MFQSSLDHSQGVHIEQAYLKHRGIIIILVLKFVDVIQSLADDQFCTYLVLSAMNFHDIHNL